MPDFMKLRSVLRVLLIMLTLDGVGLAFEEADFPLSSFSLVEAEHSLPESKGNLVDSDTPGFSTSVVFSGISRKLSPSKRRFLRSLAAARPADKKMILLYEREIRISQDGKNYWVPIQKQVHSSLDNELKPGQSFLAHLRYMGNTDSVRIYLLVDFEGPDDRRN